MLIIYEKIIIKKQQVVLNKIYHVISVDELSIGGFYLIYIIIIITINLVFKIILLYSWS